MGTREASAKERRSALLRDMEARSPNSVKVVIPFQNDDVPRYLENLRRFEEWSRKTSGRVQVK